MPIKILPRIEIKPNQRQKFIDALLVPDYERNLIYLLYSPIPLPPQTNLYEAATLSVRTIFMERPIALTLSYRFQDTAFELAIEHHNGNWRTEQVAEILSRFINQAIRNSS